MQDNIISRVEATQKSPAPAARLGLQTPDWVCCERHARLRKRNRPRLRFAQNSWALIAGASRRFTGTSTAGPCSWLETTALDLEKRKPWHVAVTAMQQHNVGRLMSCLSVVVVVIVEVHVV